MALDLEKNQRQEDGMDRKQDSEGVPDPRSGKGVTPEWSVEAEEARWAKDEGGGPMEWPEEEEIRDMRPSEEEGKKDGGKSGNEDGVPARNQDGAKREKKTGRRSAKKEGKAGKVPNLDTLKNLIGADPFDTLFEQLFGDGAPDRNLPNKLTLARIALIPVFMGILYWNFPGAAYVALLVFMAASLTDLFDGKLARKYHLVTDFGKFADPLADKMLVTAAMLWFVEIHKMPAWALLIVICREFAVSGLRMVAADKGRVIAAGWSGKVKTAATMVCVILMFFPLPAVLNWLCVAAITLTTIYSGVEYFLKNKEVL